MTQRLQTAPAPGSMPPWPGETRVPSARPVLSATDLGHEDVEDLPEETR